jgi:CDP-glycerol glycerophosphotransferase (TagB/SpsB family)
MILSEISGNALFVFSDPGAAKPILAFIIKNRDKFLNLNIISDRFHQFYDDFDLEVTICDDISIEILKSIAPDFIFTGTSHKSKIDIKAIYLSKKLKIRSYVYLDHSTYVLDRFELNSKNYFPDYIFVSDTYTKDKLIDNGIVSNKIIIIDNPYLSWLRNWTPSISKNIVFSVLNLDINKKLVLYVPDPLSNKDDALELFGYDELIATYELNLLFKKIKSQFNLILKPHPNQNIERLKRLENNTFVITPSNFNINLLMFHADYVIGFFSNSLIEAEALNKKIIRYFPSNLKNDPLSYKEIGIIADFNSLLNLIE